MTAEELTCAIAELRVMVLAILRERDSLREQLTAARKDAAELREALAEARRKA